MKYTITIIMILSLALQAKAQDTCQYFEWANGAVSANDIQSSDIAVDAAGNSYATGFFKTSITFGNHTLMSQGNQDMYVVKTDPQGQVLWATRAGGNYLSSIIFARNIAIDAMGNSYVSGNFMGAVSFGSTTLTNLTSIRNFFIAKLDPNGQFLWAVQADSARQNEHNKALAVDAQGNSFIYGKLYGTATFGGTSLTALQFYNSLFLAKLNTNGQYEWAYNIGRSKSNSAEPSGISLDPIGNILITGSFGFDTFFIGSQSIRSDNTGGNLYIAKFNGQGQMLWANFGIGGGGVGGGNIHTINNISDVNGNIYVFGGMGGLAEFGNITLTSTIGGENPAYICKLDPNGQFVSAIKILGDNPNISRTIGKSFVSDDKGNLYLTGFFTGTVKLGNTVLSSPSLVTYHTFVAKIEPQDLTIEWAISSSKGNALGYGIGIDSAQNCYITGEYRDSAMFDNTQLTTTKYNMFVAKINTECPTDINDYNKNTEPIKVYPNPAQGNGFSIIVSDNYKNDYLEVNIYDITGRKLHNHKGSIEEINNALRNIATNAAKGLWTVQLISHTSGKSESVRVSIK